MKKLYSIVAVMAAIAINAQGTENLDAQPVTPGSSYTNVTFGGQDNTSWALATARIVNSSTNYAISGTSALMNANGTVTITFPNGIGDLKFQYMKAFTGGTARSIQVSVDGAVVNTTATFGSGSGAQTTVYDYSYSINKATSTVVEVKVLGAQTSLDNFSWTTPVLAVGNASASKATLVKNTVVENNLIFGAKADAKIINANGQVVKSVAADAGTSVDVSSLAKGMYIVTGTVNGQAVSQKIIKK